MATAVAVSFTAVLAASCSALDPTAPTDSPSATSSSPSESPTPTPSTLAEAYASARSAVVRIQSYSCPPGQGTGFAISPTEIVTAAHVVEDATEIRVIHEGVPAVAKVVGLDSGRDVALLEVDTDLPSFLELADEDPAIGQQVAVLGYTMGATLSYKPGTVNAVDRKEKIEETTRYGLIELDSVADSGNSGGPLVGPDATVGGIFVAAPGFAPGQRLAVPASTVNDLVTAWRAENPAIEEPGYPPCGELFDPDADESEADDEESSTSAVLSAAHSLLIYFDAMNHGDYEAANSQFYEPMDLEKFRDQVSSSRDEDFEIFGQREIDGRPVIGLRFVSFQEEGKGPSGRSDETCTIWTLRYRFAERDGMWLIDKAEAADPDTGASEPCESGE